MSPSIKRSFLFNLLVVLLVFFALYFLFFASLQCVTRHGKEQKIPNITGKDIHAAAGQLEEMGFEVYVDSTYEPKQKAYVVLKQMPDVGSIVKRGRTVFITVNKATPPQTQMPNLISLSYRSAEMILKNNKLLVGDTTYKPDIAAGAILQQLYNGKDIQPKQMIPQGSKISLVIGDGLGITQFDVPNVIGISYMEGIATLSGNSLQYTPVWDGVITDSAIAIIYDQTPKPYNELSNKNRIKAGDVIDIRIKQNPTPEELNNNIKAPTPVNTGNNNNNSTQTTQPQ